MKIIFFLLLVFLPWVAGAHKYTVIKGRVKCGLNQVTLFKAVNGTAHIFAETQVAADSSYGFTFIPDSTGFYTLGTEKANYVVYVKGGEEINIEILEGKAELTGRNTKENRVLYLWEDFVHSIRAKADFLQSFETTYKEFFPEYTRFLADAAVFRKSLKSGNRIFDTLLQEKIDCELIHYPVVFVLFPRLIRPERSDYPVFYDSIVSGQKFITDGALQLPIGMEMVRNYIWFASRESKDTVSSMDKRLSHIGNDRIKGEYLLEYAKQIKSYDEYLDLQEKYGQYFITPSQRTRMDAIGATLYRALPGDIAADFTYSDKDGREVSLSDFRGKVILVDVWASWCAPCRQQIPYLKKLEEEMRGKDVVFMGVSVDEKKDYGKWLQIVEKEKLSGVQLFANGWSRITKAYKIKTIPRFMLFDREGRIISVDSPRPSIPELKLLIEDELKK